MSAKILLVALVSLYLAAAVGDAGAKDGGTNLGNLSIDLSGGLEPIMAFELPLSDKIHWPGFAWDGSKMINMTCYLDPGDKDAKYYLLILRYDGPETPNETPRITAGP